MYPKPHMKLARDFVYAWMFGRLSGGRDGDKSMTSTEAEENP